MKKILLSILMFAFAGAMYAAGTSSPITGFSWDNVRKVIRFMTSDGAEIQVAEAPKQYVAGQTYNGVALTVTSGLAGFSVIRGTFIPYRTIDGAWRLRFNFIAGCTAQNLVSATITIAGVTFVSPGYQVIPCMFAGTGTTAIQQCYTNPSASTVVLTYASSFNTASGLGAAGDVELASKPTWAD